MKQDSSVSKIYINNKTCLLVSICDEKEIVYNIEFGHFNLKLLFGNLKILEYKLNSNETINLYADEDNQLRCSIKHDSNFMLNNLTNFLMKNKQNLKKKTIEEIKKLCLNSKKSSFTILYVERDLDLFYLRFAYLRNQMVYNDWIKLNDKTQFSLKKDWEETLKNELENKLDIKKNPVVMITGGKNSGKSTLLRWLINHYLNKNGKNKKVYYLDLDPGQTEFTNPGQISLIEITKPLLYPTYINLNKFKKNVIFSCSVCSTNVEDLGKFYSENLAYLWYKIQNIKNDDGIIFVNTMGFVRTIGFMILIDSIKIIKPNFLIEIKFELVSDKTIYDINYPIDLLPKNISNSTGWLEFDSDYLKTKLDYNYIVLKNEFDLRMKKANILRINSQLAYLANIELILEKPLNFLKPIELKFENLCVFIQSENPIENNLIFDVLNCSWVHLCKIDFKKPNNEIFILEEFGPNQCLGNGFIRNIDLNKKLLYILTPESNETINQVNCIVKPSSINVPKEIFLPQIVYSNVEPVYVEISF